MIGSILFDFGPKISPDALSTKHMFDHVSTAFVKITQKLNFVRTRMRTGSMDDTAYFLFPEHYAFSEHF